MQPERLEPAGAGETAAPLIVYDVLQSSGRPLDAATRRFFESRFGYDLSRVRTHTGADGARAAEAVNAQAFTVGRHIVFDRGAYRPESAGGRKLLAHELVHVMQQNPASGESAAVENVAAATLRRTAYADCNSDQLGPLRHATRRALDDLGTAIGMLSRRPLIPHVSDALWLMFRDRSERMARWSHGYLSDLRRGLDGATIECEQPTDLTYGLHCDEGVGGYVIWASLITGLGHIHLCMGAWDSRSDVLQAHAIIHESAHLLAHARDYAYFRAEDCTETAASAEAAATTSVGITPVSRTDNADCYACLVRLLATMSEQEVAARVGLYQGETLRLRQSPAGEIDLDAGELSTVFQIGIPDPDDPERTDVPELFQFRWVLWDAERNEYPLRGLFGGEVRQFGRHQSQVIIPQATRDLLRRRGVARGTVYCRYMMTGMGERLYWLPVRFRR